MPYYIERAAAGATSEGSDRLVRIDVPACNVQDMSGAMGLLIGNQEWMHSPIMHTGGTEKDERQVKTWKHQRKIRRSNGSETESSTPQLFGVGISDLSSWYDRSKPSRTRPENRIACIVSRPRA